MRDEEPGIGVVTGTIANNPLTFEAADENTATSSSSAGTLVGKKGKIVKTDEEKAAATASKLQKRAELHSKQMQDFEEDNLNAATQKAITIIATLLPLFLDEARLIRKSSQARNEILLQQVQQQKEHNLFMERASQNGPQQGSSL
jgi:hypothetical protein